MSALQPIAAASSAVLATASSPISPVPIDSARCAVAVQETLAQQEQMRFRIGVYVGDVIVQGENLFGDGVNIAARLEVLAEPGGNLDFAGRTRPDPRPAALCL